MCNVVHLVNGGDKVFYYNSKGTLSPCGLPDVVSGELPGVVSGGGAGRSTTIILR